MQGRSLASLCTTSKTFRIQEEALMLYNKNLKSKTQAAVVLLCVLTSGISTMFAAPTDDVWGPATSYEMYFHRGGYVTIPAGKDKKAFSSQSVTCPASHTRGCAIRVETTILFQGIDSEVFEKIFLDGFWHGTYSFSATTGFDDERTILYVWPWVDPGQTVTVDVKLYSSYGGASTGESWEVVELLYL